MSTENKQVEPQDQDLAANLMGAVNQGGVNQSDLKKTVEGDGSPAANAEQGAGTGEKTATAANKSAANKQQPPAPTAPAANVLKKGQVAVDATEFEQFKAFQEQQRLNAERDQAALNKAKVDADNLAQRRKDLSATYGPDFILAKGKDGVERPFTTKTWELLGGDKNKEGLKRIIEVPAEVINMANGK
jgi:hypothetical protein